MATAGEIIKAALRNIGRLGYDDSESPTTNEMTNCIATLNRMITGWQAEGLIIPQASLDSFALTIGKANYTYGTGGDFNSTRPVRLTSAYIRVSNNDYPLEIIDRDSYNRIVAKSSQGRPDMLYYDPQATLAVVYLYPVPNSADTLYLDTLKPFAQFSAEADVITIPDEWLEAIEYNLAVRLAPSYRESLSDDVRRLAIATKNRLSNLTL